LQKTGRALIGVAFFSGFFRVCIITNLSPLADRFFILRVVFLTPRFLLFPVGCIVCSIFGMDYIWMRRTIISPVSMVSLPVYFPILAILPKGFL